MSILKVLYRGGTKLLVTIMHPRTLLFEYLVPYLVIRHCYLDTHCACSGILAAGRQRFTYIDSTQHIVAYIIKLRK